MRIAVAGATGRIGRRAMAALRRDGHTPIAISRSNGVDVSTGAGLDAALAGAGAVIDATNVLTRDPGKTVAFFRTATGNLLAAEQRAGVGHHVLLSIVGIDRVTGNAHYLGKLAQEEAIGASSVPATIVRCTQFFDFPLMIASWTRDGDTVTLPPLLMQPIAPDDIAGMLAKTAAGPPQQRYEAAGPETQDLIDMARRSFTSRGEDVRIVPTWDGPMGTAMAGKVLLPGGAARLGPTTFGQWLASGAAQED